MDTVFVHIYRGLKDKAGNIGEKETETETKTETSKLICAAKSTTEAKNEQTKSE